VEVTIEGTRLSPDELLAWLQAKIGEALSYTRIRRRRFRRGSIAVRLLSLLLSGASTVILGLQNLTFWASLAFSLVAVTTVLSAVEPFFNWRSRWVLMEDMQARLHRLDHELTYLVANRHGRPGARPARPVLRAAAGDLGGHLVRLARVPPGREGLRRLSTRPVPTVHCG
jgi:hypothetical protein